jgi:hypothetical protein
MTWSVKEAEIVSFDVPANDLDLSNDGQRIAIAGRKGVQIRRLKDGAVLQELAAGLIGWGVAFIRGGKEVAYTAQDRAGNTDLYFAAPKGKPKAMGAYGPAARAHSIARTPEGKLIAIGGGSLQVWDTESERITAALQAAKPTGHVRAWLSKDGERVYVYGSEEKKVVRYAMDLMKADARWDAPRPFASYLSVSQNERFLVAIGERWAGIALHDLSKGVRPTSDSAGTYEFNDREEGQPFVFTPDGKALVTFSARATVFSLPDLKSGALAPPVLEPGTQCNAGAVASDVAVVAFGSDSSEKVVCLKLAKN